MTKIKFFIVFILTIVLGGCSNDDTDGTLEGTWRLRTASVPQGSVIDYADNEVTWTFSQNTHTVIVENNIMGLGPETVFSGLATGTYGFSIFETKGKKTLYIEGAEQGIFAYTDANLVINSEADANGIIKVFKR